MRDFELKVLREISGDPQPDLAWGAAMSVALEHLQGSGYVTRGERPKLTDEGWDYLNAAPLEIMGHPV